MDGQRKGLDIFFLSSHPITSSLKLTERFRKEKIFQQGGGHVMVAAKMLHQIPEIYLDQ